MADIAITELPVATTAAITDVFPVAQGDVTRQITLSLMFTSPTLTNASLITPAIGTPSSGDLSNCTGSPVLTTPSLGTATATKITSTSDILISATGKLGYTTGSAGAVTQATSKSTGVTLDKTNGQITLNGAALAADTTVSFTLSSIYIGANDVLILNHINAGTAGSYLLNAQASPGSAVINVRNITTGSLSEAIVIAFAVIKAAVA